MLTAKQATQWSNDVLMPHLENSIEKDLKVISSLITKAVLKGQKSIAFPKQYAYNISPSSYLGYTPQHIYVGTSQGTIQQGNYQGIYQPGVIQQIQSYVPPNLPINTNIQDEIDKAVAKKLIQLGYKIEYNRESLPEVIKWD